MQYVALFRWSAWLGHCTLGKFTVIDFIAHARKYKWDLPPRMEVAVDLTAVNGCSWNRYTHEYSIQNSIQKRNRKIKLMDYRIVPTTQ